MNNKLSRYKGIVLVIIIFVILVGLSTWEYKQFLLIQNLKQTVIGEKTESRVITTKESKFFSPSGISKPLEGAVQLSATEEEQVFNNLIGEVIKLRAEERTTGRLPLLGEEEWLDLSKFVERVGRIFCPLDKEGKLFSTGSGFLVNSDGNVLTNYHVIEGVVGNKCLVGFASDFRQPPNKVYIAYLTERYDSEADYAWLYLEKLIYPKEEEITSRAFPYIPACDSNIVKLGDPILILGYPKYGGETITVTNGIISGSLGNYFKTNAQIDEGNSGGPVMIDDPRYECYIGIATAGIKGALGVLNYAVKTRSIAGYNW
ncbi:MAG: serine protease [Candidatus Pacearchaeota archaeon]